MRITFVRLVVLALWCGAAESWAQSGDKGGGGKGQDTKQSQKTSSDTSGLLGGSPSTPPVIVLSGKIVLPDGSTPPQPVRVELICRETLREHCLSSPNGSFTLQIDHSRPMAGMDASFGGAETTMGIGAAAYESPLDSIGRTRMGLGPTIDLRGCELRLNAAGFVAEPVRLESRRIEGFSDVGLVVAYPKGPRPAGTVSMVSLAAPGSAKKAFSQAEKELQRERPDLGKVADRLEKAVREYPSFAVAWELLGRLRLSQGDPAGAREAFDRATSADPDYAGGQLALAALNFQEHRWKESADAASRAIKLSSGGVRPYYFHAFSSFQAGDLDASRVSAEQIMKMGASKDYPIVHYIVGAVCLKHGDLQTAATEFQAFLDLQPDTPMAGSLREQLEAWKEQGVVPAARLPLANPAPVASP